MTQILDIITAIGLVSIATKTKTPNVFDVENAVKSVRELPARVIFPVQIEDNQGESEYVTLGNTMQHNWTIYDLMLYHSATNTSNKLQFMPELVTYVANYKKAFKARINQKLGLEGVTIVGISSEWNDYIFPPESKNKYHGALMTLTVTEIDS